jgi:hypothetical protein
MTRRFLIAGLLLVAVGGSIGEDKPEAKKASANAGLEKMKKLVGTWVTADEEGKPTDQVVSVIKLTAGGSTIHETLFPGQDHEMVSIYTTDGPDLVMTHYCMLGNQPRMKADPNSKKGTIRFAFAGGTNLDPAKDMHMHGATLTFVDDDHIEIAGEAWVDGKPSENHCGTMKLVRKK